jgi:hypothetical protein
VLPRDPSIRAATASNAPLTKSAKDTAKDSASFAFATVASVAHRSSSASTGAGVGGVCSTARPQQHEATRHPQRARYGLQGEFEAAASYLCLPCRVDDTHVVGGIPDADGEHDAVGERSREQR